MSPKSHALEQKRSFFLDPSGSSAYDGGLPSDNKKGRKPRRLDMQYPTRLGRAPLSSNGTFCIISLSLCALILFGLPSSVRGQYETQELPASDGTEGAQIGDSVALDGGRRFTPGELYYGDFGGIWRSRLDGTGAVLAVPFAGASFLALDPVG